MLCDECLKGMKQSLREQTGKRSERQKRLHAKRSMNLAAINDKYSRFAC
jgi:hypothetical protein